jgi:hypothetical protein
MTLQEATEILKAHGKPTCTCKYGSQQKMIEEAQKLSKQS